MLASTLALTGKKAIAIGRTSVLAGATAVTIGADPIPWAIGAAGGTVAYAYRMPETRLKALSNGIISVFFGGLIAPFTSALIATKVGPEWANDYVLAIAMSAGWPWALPALAKFAERWLDKKGNT